MDIYQGQNQIIFFTTYDNGLLNNSSSSLGILLTGVSDIWSIGPDVLPHRKLLSILCVHMALLLARPSHLPKSNPVPGSALVVP